MQIQTIKNLIPYAKNSRTHSEEQIRQLAGAIDHFGFAGVVVVRDGVIAKGHGTVRAVQRLLDAGKSIYPAPGRAAGASPYPDGHLPVLDATGWSDSDFRAYCLADNQHALNAGWDDELLALELGDLRDVDFDLDLIGFDLGDLEDLLGAEEVEGNTDPDDIPEEPEEPVARPGDVWQLGEHRVMCGDSTKAEDVGRLMGGERADMVFTDPPYGIDYSDNKDGTKIENDSMNDSDFVNFLTTALNHIVLFTVDSCAFYIWFATLKVNIVLNAISNSGLVIKNWIIWSKDCGSRNMTSNYRWAFEPCLYLGKSKKDNPVFYGDKSTARNVWDIPDPKSFAHKNDDGSACMNIDHYGHPNHKPSGLALNAINNSSKVGDIILDTFGGSGTTLIACEKTNRKCRMMEISPNYVDVIIKRWEDFTGNKAELINE